MWASLQAGKAQLPLEGQTFTPIPIWPCACTTLAGGRALKPRSHQPYPSVASDMSVERVPKRIGLSRSILVGVFRIVLLSWAFVTAVVLWQLR